MTLAQDLYNWLEENDHESLESLCGVMRQFHSRDSSVVELAEYYSM